MELIGADGCRVGWTLAVRAGGGDRVRFYLTKNLDAVFREVRAGRAVVAIDMPIGLPDREPRACDVVARQLLGARRSSVFAVPCRKAVWATSAHAARKANQLALGCSISEQALGILKNIRLLDRLMTSRLQDRVRETHPEVAFTVLNGGRPMSAHKRTERGREERLVVLRAHGIQFDPAEERRWLGPGDVSEDDLVDAAACLLTAERIAARSPELVTLPKASDGWIPPCDRRRLRMEIVA